jgi:hypothetical protein
VLYPAELEPCDNIDSINRIAVLTEKQRINVVVDVPIGVPDELDI